MDEEEEDEEEANGEKNSVHKREVAEKYPASSVLPPLPFVLPFITYCDDNWFVIFVVLGQLYVFELYNELYSMLLSRCSKLSLLLSL